MDNQNLQRLNFPNNGMLAGDEPMDNLMLDPLQLVYLGDQNARLEFEKRFAELPDFVRYDLLKKNLQLVDRKLYWTKDVSAKSDIQMIQTSDDKVVGISNVLQSKLDKERFFLLQGIQVLQASIEVASIQSANYKQVTDDNIINAEFSLKFNRQTIMDEQPLDFCAPYNNTSASISNTGYWKLDCPKIIYPEKEMRFDIRFPSAVGINTALKLIFIGAEIVPLAKAY